MILLWVAIVVTLFNGTKQVDCGRGSRFWRGVDGESSVFLTKVLARGTRLVRADRPVAVPRGRLFGSRVVTLESASHALTIVDEVLTAHDPHSCTFLVVRPQAVADDYRLAHRIPDTL